jgi:hypothetical protein
MRKRFNRYNTSMVKIGLINELYYLNRKRVQETKGKFVLVQNISNRLIDFLNNRRGDCIIGGDKVHLLKIIDYQKVKTLR